MGKIIIPPPPPEPNPNAEPFMVRVLPARWGNDPRPMLEEIERCAAQKPKDAGR